MIRVLLHNDVIGLNLGVSIVRHPEPGDFKTQPEILRLGSSDRTVFPTWEEIPGDGTEIAPTFWLDQIHARALLDAFAGHFHGAEDTRALRRDYDHERKRVDELVGHLAAVTCGLVGGPEPLRIAQAQVDMGALREHLFRDTP